MALLKLTSVVAVVLLAACERTPAEIVLSQQSYAVHVVVEADSNAVMALPTSTSPDAQTVAVPALMHISMDDGAHVVFLPVDQVTCRGTAGCYRAAIHVASGARFIVDGQIDNGPSFEGSTVVPQPPVIVSPASGAVISLSCTTVQACIGSAFSPAVGIVELNMNSDSSAARIEVRVIADSVPGVAGASCMGWGAG